MLNKNGLPPKKSLGQNFLNDPNIARKIVAALELNPEDSVIEIGPGHGVLTEIILPQVHQYWGVELDNELALRLKTKYEGTPNFQLVHEDFLKIDLEKIIQTNAPCKLVGNIPYHITSSVIFNTIKQRQLFDSLTLMIQLEVARRIAAGPCSKEYGILSVLSQTFSRPQLLFQVSRNVFFPKPKVTSAVVQWNFTDFDSLLQKEDEAGFISMVKSLFQYRRKMLRNSLWNLIGEKTSEVPFDLTRRPEELTIPEFIELYASVKKLS